jgi:hypothetical protein
LQGEPGTPEFVVSYNAAVATKVAPVPGTLRSMLIAYQGSSDFTSARDRTRETYAWHITRIERKLADFPLVALADPRTFLAWRDDLASKSASSADMTWAVLNKALSWALDRGLVTHHRFTKARKLYRGTRANKIWQPEDEQRFPDYKPRVCKPPSTRKRTDFGGPNPRLGARATPPSRPATTRRECQ